MGQARRSVIARDAPRTARVSNAGREPQPWHCHSTRSCSCPAVPHLLLQLPHSTSAPKQGNELIHPATCGALAKANTYVDHKNKME